MEVVRFLGEDAALPQFSRLCETYPWGMDPNLIHLDLVRRVGRRMGEQNRRVCDLDLTALGYLLIRE